MTLGEPGAELRAIDDAPSEAAADVARSHDAGANPSARPSLGPGLGALHISLDRLVATLGLRSLTVVVDDPDLGRQAFRAGPGPFEPGTLAGRPGCRSDPPLAADRVDAELLVELCATALRLEVARAGTSEATGLAAAELALRSLPGVQAVVIEHDGDVMIVQVHASADAPPDLARAAGHASAPLADARLVVEVIREVGQRPPAVEVTPEAVPEPARTLGDPPSEAVSPPQPSGVPEIITVRNDAETGEIEVHVRVSDVRTIGRAPVTQGLAGAVNATLDALRSADPDLEFALEWARTIEALSDIPEGERKGYTWPQTTADRRFVVAVALLHSGTRVSRHGLASGASPIEAAARAALDAVTRESNALD